MKTKVYESRDRTVRLDVRGGARPSFVKATAQLADGWEVWWRFDVLTMRPRDPVFRLNGRAVEIEDVPDRKGARPGSYRKWKKRVDALAARAKRDFPDMPAETRSRTGGDAEIDLSRVLKLRDQGLTTTEIAERLGCHPGAVRTALKRWRERQGPRPAPRVRKRTVKADVDSAARLRADLDRADELLNEMMSAD